MHTSSLQQNILAELHVELAGTRKVLERVPFEQAEYRPHPKSMTLWQLATHVVNLLAFKTLFVTHDSRDFLDPDAPKPGPTPTSKEELLARFDEYSATLQQELQATTDEKLTHSFKLHRGEQVMFDRPKSTAIRLMGLNHSIHHRGQLTVYLRLLDIPVPGLYGPSADEK
ncbi:DinB family protein [Microvirga sp. STR05]|uniref:DinB family protein n=1 Tax=Hymenobacter duratus TaxID=2771356 RepID=A0ABR8JK38_9BACT|nr:DinB family protein [Hymenobacter duratus]MBD2715169.1 DinB family protein [Hymenobacter duratus]MBR7950076.1 DinB family protein [Microvirga sp. STR05]